MKWLRVILCLIVMSPLCWANRSPSNGKVLVVLSGVDYVELKNGSHHETGWFFPELVTPAQKILEAGYELVFANPTGKEALPDKLSFNKVYFNNDELELQKALNFIQKLKNEDISNFSNPLKLENITNKDITRYKAIFFPGGHAPMQDLYRNSDVGRILSLAHDNNIITAAICHAPVVFSVAPKGTYSGYRMTVFSKEEEKQVENNPSFIDGELLFYVSDSLKVTVGKEGMVTKASKPWEPSTERDREVITGQNPASHHEFTDLIIEALVEKRLRGRSLKNWDLQEGGVLVPGRLYDVSNRPSTDWSKGFVTVYLGKKLNPNESGMGFRRRFTTHVNEVHNRFAKAGNLKGYYVMVTDNEGIAYHLWKDEKSFNVAMASQDGKTIHSDMSSFLKTLQFKAATSYPVVVRTCQKRLHFVQKNSPLPLISSKKKVNEDMIACVIDHTFLKTESEGVSKEDQKINVLQLSRGADIYGAYSVCVREEMVSTARKILTNLNSDVKIVSVIGFPIGDEYSTEDKIKLLEQVRDDGADEFDMVINYKALTAGDTNSVYRDLVEISRASGTDVLKVIFENAYLAETEKKQAYGLAMAAFVESFDGDKDKLKYRFLKTSTGFAKPKEGIAVGATLDDVRLMFTFGRGLVGIKPAGGVSSLRDAIAHFEAVGSPWRQDGLSINPLKYRIGSSSLLGKLFGFVSGSQY